MSRFLCLSFLLLVGADKPQYRWLTVEATHYCPCSKCTDGDGKTATNRSAYKDGIAVDKTVIALGSHIDLPAGYSLGPNANGSWVKVDDTGVEGNRIDIRVQSHDEAKRLGRKKMRIRIWEP